MTLKGVCGCSGMLCPASEWMGVLASFRPATSRVRLAKICQTLLENGFMQWPMLEHADDPSCWVGADSHDKEDLDLRSAVAHESGKAPAKASGHPACIFAC